MDKKAAMLSRSLSHTTQAICILALGVLTACGGGAGAPSTPPLGAPQAAPQLEKTAAGQNAAIAGNGSAPLQLQSSSVHHQDRITEYSLPTVGAAPFGIAAGPDGNLWFTESTSNIAV